MQVAERACGQAWPLPEVVNKLQLETIGRQVGRTMHAVGGKVVVLALCTAADDRRAGGLEALERVCDGVVVKGVERGAVDFATLVGTDCRDQLKWPGDAAHRLGETRQGVHGAMRGQRDAAGSREIGLFIASRPSASDLFGSTP